MRVRRVWGGSTGRCGSCRMGFVGSVGFGNDLGIQHLGV